jgi:hypothetical protein
MGLVILVALALVVSTVQCAAACVEDDCGAKSQPCHHHDSSKQVKCAREIPAAKTPTLVSAATPTMVAAAVTLTTISFIESLLVRHEATPAPPLPALRI